MRKMPHYVFHIRTMKNSNGVTFYTIRAIEMLFCDSFYERLDWVHSTQVLKIDAVYNFEWRNIL